MITVYFDDSESSPPLGSDSTGFDADAAEASSPSPDAPALAPPALDSLNLSS